MCELQLQPMWVQNRVQCWAVYVTVLNFGGILSQNVLVWLVVWVGTKGFRVGCKKVCTVQCKFQGYPYYFNPLNAELNPICCFLALLGAHHFLHVSRIRVKSLTL